MSNLKPSSWIAVLLLVAASGVAAAPDVAAPTTLDGHPVCEASAAIEHPCLGDARKACVLVADNEIKDEIFQYSAGDDGLLTKAAAWHVAIGNVEVDDAEAFAPTDKGTLMIGSHSRKKSCKRDEKRLRVARLEPTEDSNNTMQAVLVTLADKATWADRLKNCEQQLIVIPDAACNDACNALRHDICQSIAEAETAADAAIGQPDDPCDKKVHAFNIEGAAAITDASGKLRVWVGLRSPLVHDKAVLLRLAASPSSPSPITFDGMATIDLGGKGVRELTTRDGWLWGIAGTTGDGSEPSRLWRVKEELVRDNARIDGVRFVNDSLPSSAEGLIIDAFSNRALIVIDGDRGDDANKCEVEARQQVFPLGPISTWGDAEVSPEGPRVSITAVDDTATVIFEGASVDLSSNNGERRATRFFAVNLPVSVADDVWVIGFKQDLRGHVAKSAGARALLVVDLNGVTQTIDLPYGDGPVDEPMTLEINRQSFAVDERLPKDNDPQGFRRITGYEARFLLIAERRSRADVVRLDVDAIDLRLIRQPQGG